MKDIFSTVYTSISKVGLRTFNYSKTRGKALCLNILEVPNTTVSLITISLMNNKHKTPSLDMKDFARLMSCIETQLSKTAEYVNCNEFPYFIPVSDKINGDWYRRLNCHRLFIIPTRHMFSAIQYLTTEDFISYLDACGVSELSLYVDTKTNKLKITRFQNK